LQLPQTVMGYIEGGTLSAGHARTLVATDNPQDLAEKIIKLGLSVRQAEDLTREQAARPRKPQTTKEKDADTRALEHSLTAALGLSVHIDHQGVGGSLIVKYTSLEQLELIAHRLSKAD
jgi:ParB family transcriptional regulator, chromosome partitioning protein